VDHEEATSRLLDSAEALFYEKGIQAVGMDAIRAHSGVSLKRLYSYFPSKESLVEAYLTRRDGRWLGRLATYVAANADRPENAVPAVFDWVHVWFSEPDFRGCAFINSFGEVGSISPRIAAVVRAHKKAVHDYLLRLTREAAAERPDELAGQLLTLLEGATVVAAITGDPSIARSSRAAAITLLGARTNGSGRTEPLLPDP
jgi:AcrR family transcriptional regulator